MNRLGFLLAYSVTLITIAGILMRGPWLYLTVIYIFGIIPLLDLFVGRDPRNFNEQDYRLMQNSLYFRLITYLHVPIQWALVVTTAAIAAQSDLRGWEWLGLVLSTGLVTGGVGITLAHELGHRSQKFEQHLAKALLWTVCYMHFFIEHNHGHHAKVATPADPASAHLGESFYRFLPRTLFGGVHSAWCLERRRLQRKGFGVVSSHNQMLWFGLLPLTLAAGLGWTFGPWAIGFFFAQSFVAITLLELVNYVEHYGLTRQKDQRGRYEKVQIHHSWNASEVLTNYLLFQLQRHADHHANANRRYQQLRHFDESPQLPTGYAGMILVALVPPLWRRIMDPRVQALRHVAVAPA